MTCNAETNQAATCQCCHHEMMLVRSIPKLGVLPELRIFFCPACGEVESQEAISGAA
jgi:transposase